jgi:uncharacterized protein
MNHETKTPTSKGGTTANRGFASMTKERRKELARMGGEAAHRQGTAHQWTPEEARAAGRKGGMVSRGGKGRLPQ